MGAAADKIKGLGNQAAGNIKEATGKVVGNDRLQAEGLAQQGVGKAQEAVGEAKGAIKKVVNKNL